MDTAQPLNHILLTVDCWRGDQLGATGAVPSPTPNLDRLAKSGTVFEQAVTCGGWTRPAMMALFSSVYASHHQGGSLRRLSPDLPVLAELLDAQGYQTAGFTANAVCGVKAGFDRGFRMFADLKTNDRQSLLLHRLRKVRGYHRVFLAAMSQPLTHSLLRLLGVRVRLPESSASARQLTDEALAWLGQMRKGPFFLWAHYIDLHWPYRLSQRHHDPRDVAQAWRDRRTYRQIVRSQGRFDPGIETRERWQRLYREELVTVDQQLGRLLARLRETGHWAHTAIVVTSDHGEEFFERGTWAHSWNQLFAEGVHVPLIVRVPGAGEGLAVRHLVSLLDVAPTVLELSGVQPPETMKGRSLLPLLTGAQARETALGIRSEALVEMLGHRNSHRYRLAIRTEAQRYIYDIERPHDSQLYDREADPQELDNLYDKKDQASRQFDELRFEHMASVIPDLLGMEDDVDALADTDPEVVARLRDLGYVE